MDKLHFAFGVLGNASALFLFLAPVITFKRILQRKSTEQFSGVPYVMTLLNNLLSAWGKILDLLALVLTVFAVVVLVSLFALHGNNRKLFCGLAATIFSIVMYASPLTIIRLVIKTKSVEFMPFFLSLFVFFCGTCFFIFGLLGKDPFVAIPNGFGSGLGAVQLILYAIYRKNKGTKTSTYTAGDGSIGMEKPNTKPHPEDEPSTSMQPQVDSQV